MQMQISIAFMGCRDMARPSVLWPFGGMKLPFLCCAHCLFPMLEFINQKTFPSPTERPVRSYLIDCSSKSFEAPAVGSVQCSVTMRGISSKLTSVDYRDPMWSAGAQARPAQ